MDSSDVNADHNVSELFDEALQIYDDILQSTESNNSATIQSQLIKAIRFLEDATKIVSLVGMFSTNETIQEVSTAEVKFLLLPALLGVLTLKLCTPHRRSEVVDTAELYFKDFIKRCNDYGVIDFGVPATVAPPSGRPSQLDAMQALITQRETKIARYKQRKDLEVRLTELRVATSATADEDLKREFYLTLIKSLASQALEELENITSERPLIAHMEAMRSSAAGDGNETPPEAARERGPPLRPIIITRDEVQKKIYGAGYPSLPTMTVREFYDQRARQGDFPDPDAERAPALPAWAQENAAQDKASREEAEEEARIERDDPEYLARKRGMDEYKDDHRRGWGNRMNRS